MVWTVAQKMETGQKEPYVSGLLLGAGYGDGVSAIVVFTRGYNQKAIC